MLVTIGICTVDRPELLGRTLRAVEELEVPTGITVEVLICDNSGEDGHTKQIAAGAVTRHKVKVLVEPKRGKSYALLQLIEEARGEWVLFLDDDVRPKTDWLVRYLDAMHRYPEAGFFAGQISPAPETPLVGVGKGLFQFNPGVCGVVVAERDKQMALWTSINAGGGNIVFRREPLLRLPIRRSLRILAERNGIFEDTVMLLEMLIGEEEGWMISSAIGYHFIPPQRSGIDWFWRWWFLRGKTFGRVGGDIPVAPRLRRFMFERRFKQLKDLAAEGEFGKVAVVMLGFVAMWTGHGWGLAWRVRNGGDGGSHATTRRRKGQKE